MLDVMFRDVGDFAEMEIIADWYDDAGDVATAQALRWVAARQWQPIKYRADEWVFFNSLHGSDAPASCKASLPPWLFEQPHYIFESYVEAMTWLIERYAAVYRDMQL